MNCRRRRFTKLESYCFWCETRKSKFFLNLYDVVGLRQNWPTSSLADPFKVRSVFLVVVITAVM